ncbi:MAG: FHA domain-containing protein [Deltaproteobacteria bacterium]|nr:FHA domain-containing protein [Deltaproteobacteria bacterium]
MFAVEIEFHDGVSSSEFLLMRRPYMRIGSNELADIVVESRGITNDLVIYRGLGNEFSVYAADTQSGAKANFLEGTYSSEAQFSFGDVSIHMISLDADLALISNEYPERVGAEAISKAFGETIERFPAVAVNGERPIFISVGREKSIIIGRSRQCALRLNATDLGQEHCRIVSSGDKLFVDALTDYLPIRIETDKIGTRRIWERSKVLSLGKEVELLPIYGDEDLTTMNRYLSFLPFKNTSAANAPMLVSNSLAVKPSRISLGMGKPITIGRDPTNDVWINAGHISRHHAVVVYIDESTLEIKDLSSNGTIVNGAVIPRSENMEMPLENAELDFGEGIKLHIAIGDQINQEIIQQQTSLDIEKKKRDTLEISRKDAMEASDITDDITTDLNTEIELSDFTESADKSAVDRVNKYKLQESFNRCSTVPVFVGTVMIISVLAALFAVWLFNN